jgi:hypothetical protein
VTGFRLQAAALARDGTEPRRRGVGAGLWPPGGQRVSVRLFGRAAAAIVGFHRSSRGLSAGYRRVTVRACGLCPGVSKIYARARKGAPPHFGGAPLRSVVPQDRSVKSAGSGVLLPDFRCPGVLEKGRTRAGQTGRAGQHRAYIEGSVLGSASRAGHTATDRPACPTGGVTVGRQTATGRAGVFGPLRFRGR